MRELSLHLLDIAENSVAAGATCIAISVVEDQREDKLRMIVEDNGKGMDARQREMAADPFFTSRTTRKVGLGIPLLKAAAEACCGFLKIESTPGKGTRLETEFQFSHIDRMPLGDLGGTILTLLVSFPAIHWFFTHEVDGKRFLFDDQTIKSELGEMPLTEPLILSFLKGYIERGLLEVQRGSVTA